MLAVCVANMAPPGEEMAHLGGLCCPINIAGQHSAAGEAQVSAEQCRFMGKVVEGQGGGVSGQGEVRA